MTTRQNYEFTAGDTPKISVAVTDNGAAFDLADYTVNLVMRQDNATGPIVLTKTTADDILFTSAGDGEFDVYFSSDDTATLPAGVYWYEIEILSSTANYTVMRGNITLLADGA